LVNFIRLKSYLLIGSLLSTGFGAREVDDVRRGGEPEKGVGKGVEQGLEQGVEKGLEKGVEKEVELVSSFFRGRI
jgi:hypothetical protein